MLDHEIVAKIRPHIPLAGEEWTYLWKLTVLPGSRVDNHWHVGHTACLYEEVGEGGEVIIDGELYHPSPGDIVYIPPGTKHEVLENTGDTPRKSYALTVIPGDNRQVIKEVVR